MTFAPATAYSHDYQFRDRVQNGQLITRAANGEQEAAYSIKLVRSSLRQGDHQARGASLYLGSTGLSWELWHVPVDDDTPEPPAPKVDDAIQLDDADDQGRQTELVITSVNTAVNGPKWLITTVEPPRNE